MNTATAIAADIARYDDIKTRYLNPVAETAHLQHHAHLYTMLDHLRCRIEERIWKVTTQAVLATDPGLIKRYEYIVHRPTPNSPAFAKELSNAEHLHDQFCEASIKEIVDDPRSSHGPQRGEWRDALYYRLSDAVEEIPTDALSQTLRHFKGTAAHFPIHLRLATSPFIEDARMPRRLLPTSDAAQHTR